MIPLRDSNPTSRTPIMTISLIVLNVLIFLYMLWLDSMGQLEPFLFNWAIIPRELLANPVGEAPTLIAAMFLHGGWAHLLGNMLYLWIFGDNIEDLLGHGRFIIFYLLTGILASFAQIAITSESSIPNLGASGAIAGILGGYLIEFPRAKVTVILFRFITEINAIYVLGFWFVFELFRGLTALGAFDPDVGGVAFFAHIGGFIAGVVLVKLFQVGVTRTSPHR